MRTVDVVQWNVETWAKFERGVNILNTLCQVMLRRVEEIGNNSEMESSRKRVLHWRWVKASSMKEALEIDADKRTSGKQPSQRLNRVYNCIESLSEQSGAERRHLFKCELVRREQCQKRNKKIAN
jgi:hypothetical protein